MFARRLAEEHTTLSLEEALEAATRLSSTLERLMTGDELRAIC